MAARKAKRAPTLRPLPVRMVRLHIKLIIAVAAGVLTALALSLSAAQPLTTLLLGWDTGAAVYLVLIFLVMRRTEIAGIRERAAEQDEGAAAILVLSIIATAASFVAIVFALGAAKQSGSGAAMVYVAMAMTTILLSWTFVHTIFALHYAHEYYGERNDGVIGGLNFPGKGDPDYRDFLYFSLVIGMTSQVSDVAVTSKVIRRMATLHGVLSFFFNVTVLALTVNMVSNLI